MKKIIFYFLMFFISITYAQNVRNLSVDEIIAKAKAYENGIGVEKDLSKAFYYYKEVAYLEEIFAYLIKKSDEGNVYAKFSLAQYYSSEKNFDIMDTKKAFNYYLEAAKKDYPPALYMVGLYYILGWGGEKNPKKAFEYYTKSAELGYAPAQRNLAILYATGNGIPIDDEKALKWWKEAAKQGYRDSIYIIALYYFHGICVEKDLKKAYELFLKYYDSNDKPNGKIVSDIGLCMYNGWGVEKDKEKALQWFIKNDRKVTPEYLDSLNESSIDKPWKF